MNFIMIGLLLREALDRLCVHLNMYLVTDKSEGDADARTLAEHIHTVRVAKRDPSTDDAQREL